MEGAEIYYQKRNERKEKVRLSRRERPGSEVLQMGTLETWRDLKILQKRKKEEKSIEKAETKRNKILLLCLPHHQKVLQGQNEQ